MLPTECKISVKDLPGITDASALEDYIESVYDYLRKTYSCEPDNFAMRIYCDGTVEISKITWRADHAT